MPTITAANGKFPDSLLAYLGWPEMDHLRLIPAAAASITRLAAAFEAEFSKPLYLSDAYRTYAQQVALKKTKGKFAATPGKSNHGLGLAIDMASRINIDNSDEHRWMEVNGPAYGWINPYWAEDYNPGNGEHEPWHWEYHFDLDTHPTSAPAPTSEEDDMTDYLAHHTHGAQQAVYLVSGPSVYLLPPSPTYPDLVFHQARGLRTVEVTGPVGMDPIRRAAEAYAAYAAARPATTVAIDYAALVAALAPLLVKALPTGGVSLEQVEAAVKSALGTLQLKSV